MSKENQKLEFIDLTAEIVSAYVSNNTVVASELPLLISNVCEALTKASAKESQPKEAALTPAVPIKRSVTPDFIVCLEDGKKFKSLKRHLRTGHSLTPEEYREKWGLSHDYPIVAPNYAASRSEMAKKMGLGQWRKGKSIK